MIYDTVVCKHVLLQRAVVRLHGCVHIVLQDSGGPFGCVHIVIHDSGCPFGGVHCVMYESGCSLVVCIFKFMRAVARVVVCIV